MANTINAITTGIGGLATTADSSGNINLQSAGATVAAVTSTGVAVTGTLSATGNITQNGNAVLNAGTTVTVSQGGTGATSATAYSVVCGGTTSTSAYQSVASLGSNGQVLTSQGAGALPTWTTISSTPTTNQVLSATAGASAGAVGTYAFLGALSAFSVTVGTNYAGSSFVFAGFMISGQDWNGSANEATYGNFGGGSPSGTWKAMGQNSSASNSKGTLFLRVA